MGCRCRDNPCQLKQVVGTQHSTLGSVSASGDCSVRNKEESKVTKKAFLTEGLRDNPSLSTSETGRELNVSQNPFVLQHFSGQSLFHIPTVLTVVLTTA